MMREEQNTKTFKGRKFASTLLMFDTLSLAIRCIKPPTFVQMTVTVPLKKNI